MILGVDNFSLLDEATIEYLINVITDVDADLESLQDTILPILQDALKHLNDQEIAKMGNTILLRMSKRGNHQHIPGDGKSLLKNQ